MNRVGGSTNILWRTSLNFTIFKYNIYRVFPLQQSVCFGGITKFYNIPTSTEPWMEHRGIFIWYL